MGAYALRWFVRKDHTDVWVQKAMVERGFARTHALDPQEACLGALLAVEAKARSSALGIWSNAAYAVRKADRAASLRKFVSMFQIVEGRVESVKVRRGRAYINFGRRRWPGFSAVVRGKALKNLSRHGLEISKMAGMRVRIRGWLELRRGPLLEILHPELIEVIVRQDTAQPTRLKHGPGVIEVGGQK